MRVGEARELIGQAVTEAVRAGFAAWYRDMEYQAHSAPAPAFCAGRERAGPDASRIPEVPMARVESRATEGEPGVFFTYKVEYGAEPLVQLSVPRTWARKIAGAGWAVVTACRWWTCWSGTTVSPRPARRGCAPP